MLPADLKNSLQLPDLEGALGLLAIAALASLGLFGLQGIAWFIVSTHLQQGDISYPLALQEGASIGRLSNLIGWGFHVNTSPRLLGVGDGLYYLAIVVLASKLLRYTPVVLVAGIGARQLEAHATGSILNWIVVPNGGVCVKLMSIGDVAVLAGLASVAAAAAWIGLTAIVALVAEVRKARAGPGSERSNVLGSARDGS